MSNVVPLWDRARRNHPSFTEGTDGPLPTAMPGEWWIRRADNEPMGDVMWMSGGNDPALVDWVSVEEGWCDSDYPVEFVAEWMVPTERRAVRFPVKCEPDPWVVEEPGEHRCSRCDQLWHEDDYVGPPVCEDPMELM